MVRGGGEATDGRRISQNTGSAMSPLLCLVAMAVILTCVLAKGPDSTVCNYENTPATGKPLPGVPDRFRAIIECNIKESQKTVELEQYYDYPNKRAAIYVREYIETMFGLFDYNTNELIYFYPQIKTCQVTNLANSSADFLYGYPANGTARMYHLADLLKMSKGEKYQGTTRIRGISVDHWQACFYVGFMDATFLVDMYFTADSWKTSLYTPHVPVRIKVVGNYWNGTQKIQLDHTYEVTAFQPYNSSIMFQSKYETPSNIVCPGRKLSKPLPSTLGNKYRFSAEIITGNTTRLTHVKEWYDFDNKLFRVDQSNQRTRTVDDFNTGVSYIDLQGTLDMCTFNQIFVPSLDSKLDGKFARIRTPQEFLYFDQTSYAYEGVGMYFEAVGNIVERGMPVGAYIQLPNKQPVILYNIYSFDNEPLESSIYDVTNCYNFTLRQDMSFAFSGDYFTNVVLNLRAFRMATVTAIATAARVSPVRISSLNEFKRFNGTIDNDEHSNILISFTLLDQTHYVGNVRAPITQISLAAAKANINSAISQGTLQVTAPNGNKLTAKQYNFLVTPPDPSNYSAGSMAALGVVMLIAFLAIGFGGMYLYYRRNGGTFKAERFDEKQVVSDE
ncbi:hypothetical protein ScPMuIL_003035 [Solemya velum]